MFRSPFVAIVSEVFYEGYITKKTKQMYKCKILSLKHVIHNIRYNINFGIAHSKLIF